LFKIPLAYFLEAFICSVSVETGLKRGSQMSTDWNGRYIIEVNDEFGSIDYDRSNSLEYLIDIAKTLNPSAKIIDSFEQAIVWEFGG
jgi:hypothetical protein